MKYHDNGCFYSVTVSKADVGDFKASWPCSGLPNRSVWFQFDKRNGDLVDIEPNSFDKNSDGAATVALALDAQTFAGDFLPEAKQHVADRS